MRPIHRFAILILIFFSTGALLSLKSPYGGSSTVYCNPIVIKQMEQAWKADANGTLREGTWEYGFRIDYAFREIQVGELIMGDAPFHTVMSTNDNTIAIAHVHPINGVSAPSELDTRGNFPDYVISKDGLWVTNPRTHTYQFVRPFNRMFQISACPAVPPVAPTKKQPKH